MKEVLGSSVAGLPARPAAELPRSTPLESLDLLMRLDLSSPALGPDAKLVVMRQNPADNYHWSKPVGEFTAGEVRAALSNEALRRGSAAGRAGNPATDEPNTSPQKDITHDH